MVVAFGQEKLEIRNYNKYLDVARLIGISTHYKSAMSVSIFFFIIFSYYSYAYYIGTKLIVTGHENTKYGEPYNAGDVISCFFGVVFGVFSLGMAAPNIKAVTEGRIAGRMAYDIIDRVPKIPLNDHNALKFEKIDVLVNLKTPVINTNFK